jgi:hypothetical protein
MLCAIYGIGIFWAQRPKKEKRKAVLVSMEKALFGVTNIWLSASLFSSALNFVCQYPTAVMVCLHLK